jgi:hypothetical protein
VQDVEAVRAGLLKTYWAAKMTMMQEKADRGAMVRPGSSAMVRDKVGLEVMLNPDVEYRVVQVIEGRCGTSSEFAVELQPPEFIEMELSDFNIIVPYELLLGTDTSAQEQAQQTGASEVRLSAQQILEGLQQTPEVKPLLPMGLTLTDEQVHYVDGETMGAVFVYQRFPISEEDKRAAPKVDRDRYQEGLGTPGVRVGQDIFIQEDACGIGTEYHEALHLATHYAGTDSRSLASLGWDFNEGVTEYFTRFVTRRLGVIRDEDQYGPQRRGIEAPLERGFISVTGLADAYFRGRTGLLLATFDEATKGQFSLEAYAACIDSDRSHSAQNVLAALTPA